MGNGVGKLSVCFTGGDAAGMEARRRKEFQVVISEPLDDLGHSFCYVPEVARLSSSSKVHSEETTTFRSISGASVSANTSTPLSTAFVDVYSYNSIDRSSTFESSTSFASIPLQPIPRNSIHSGPLLGSGFLQSSGSVERGFMSGPIERGYLSGPLDRGIFSGPLEKGSSDQFQRSFSHGGFALRSRSRKGKLIRALQQAISKTISRGQNSIVAPIKGSVSIKEPDWVVGSEKQNELTISSVNLSSECSLEDDDSQESQNLQWAQGKAGEDRVHVVVSEEHGWVFVGIYDGFNGPDAPDYLLSNLYAAVHRELKGLLWDDKSDSSNPNNPCLNLRSSISEPEDMNQSLNDQVSRDRDRTKDGCSRCVEQEVYPCAREELSSDSKLRKNNKGKNSKKRYRGVAKKWEENQRKWRCEWDRERLELDRRLKEQLNRNGWNDSGAINHGDVLKALSQALKKTEEAFLDLADKMLMENPELALMGSCVMVMLMKGEDVYVMNVGDSRAVLAQKKEPDLWSQDLERINEETLHDLEGFDSEGFDGVSNLTAFQLTTDHSTSVPEEVERIRNEHRDDPLAVINDRVKGLKVTRAFGAGFLKQPKWNNALLEMFRIDYVGTSPYITCLPSLYHHRLGPRDRFLILSSDGLYQYFTNEEAVLEVEHFISWSPEGDPAQHLVEKVLFRAAKKAGLEFHELLEIPQGDRRRYHDDVSIIVISLEGRIWRSCV
ncbi:PREDICTED: probable protein phosphatase 2C 4 [Ipomoea nil]|uniref:probable protein phosphatase 2C 4 n=1 Tax=Ipomoea nil TaxID=35883 RepID=UPI00090111B0|nr:PREDICTED: probable protein phosphatase 2C 4 [Ipomoea nil]XP_019199396.1 PREDICTED: probable protein phosphatase 2C 4 [Ipomoea nil]